MTPKPRVTGRHMATAGAILATVGLAGWACAADGGDLRALPSVADQAMPAQSWTRDPQVMPAGIGCRDGQCRGGRCNHTHLAGCRQGHCAPHCPVRPKYFGYYGTRWRRWPGSGVVQVSAESEATPVPAARSAVPSAEEESPASTTPRSLLPEDDAAETPAGGDDDAAGGERRGARAAPLPARQEGGIRIDDPARDSVGAVQPGMILPPVLPAEPAAEERLPESPAAFRASAGLEGIRPVAHAARDDRSRPDATPRVEPVPGLAGGWRRFAVGADAAWSVPGTPASAGPRSQAAEPSRR